MAEIMAWPLNLAEYAYNAEDIQRWMAGKTSGVYGAEGNWQVVSAGGMGLTIKAAGQVGGWLSNMGIYGVTFWNSSDISLTVTTADGTLSRIDRVIVSWHIPQQSSVPTVEVRKGTASSNPVGPALVNDGEYAEICLAEIHLSAGQTEITNQNIIDTRMDEDLCGIVSMGVEKYPTDGLEAEFRDWLSTLQTDLSGDVAANLLNNIETHKSDTTVHLRRLTYIKSGIVHQLAGIGTDQGVISCVFTAAAAYSSGDTFTVDGTAYTVKMQDGKSPTAGFFTSGAIVPVIVDTTAKTVNFKTGGVDISSATAGPEDVLAGKTFFSGSSDLIQTGTMDSPLVLLQTGQVELESTQVGSLGWRSYATIQAPSDCNFAVILYEDRIGCGAPDLDAPSNSDLSVTFSGSQISISIWDNVSSCTYYLYQNKGGGF